MNVSACEVRLWQQGSVAERSKALVLGTSHFDGVGSNPTAAKNNFAHQHHQCILRKKNTMRLI